MSTKRIYRVPAEMYVDVEAKDADQAWEKVHNKMTSVTMSMIMEMLWDDDRADYYFQVDEPDDITPLELEE
mgnify:CR=1 FL=1